MLVLLTGATGFVGSHVARELREHGADLRLLVRAGSPAKNIESLTADRIIGDLCDPDSLRRAVEGCEVVVHVAAEYRIWVPDADAARHMYRVNVEGTRVLLEVARSAGVRRAVYCSSVATMGFTGNGLAVNEDSPVSLDDMIGPYKRTKFQAEQLALQAARDGQDVVIVNPTTPVGEQDIKPTPSGQIILDFLKRRFPAYVDTGLNLVDVREVARGHAVALERGHSGERYILGGENLTLKQLLDKLAAITGLKSPRMRLPYLVALAAGVVDTTITGVLLNREPRAPFDAVRMGAKKMFASSSKAERELGWRVLPVEDALRRAVDWFKENGYLKPKS